MTKPLLSIVIPTKNRQKYCIEIIQHLVKLSLDNIEIVIQDNSNDDSLKRLIDQQGIYNVVYNYSPQLLSFVDNFSLAVSLCKGEYICMIGDDDTVLPNIVEVTKYALNHQIDAVIPELAVYHWPTDQPINPKWKNGYLASLPFKKNSFQTIDTHYVLKLLVINHFQNYQSLYVPRLYHGIVKRECIEKVKLKTGTFFAGLTPDMFISVALCFTTNNVLKYSKPFTISGICPKSGSSDSATGRHTGELKDAPHFRGHQTYNWINYVPQIYTVETIWAETGIQALRLMDGLSYEHNFNNSEFINYLAFKYPQFKTRLFDFAKKENITIDNESIYRFKYVVKHNLKRIVSILKKTVEFNFAREYYDVKNIDDACHILCKMYNISHK